MRLLKVATFNLNQWAMDFNCNVKNIKESITRDKKAGAVIGLGPELEITGYGREDHFLELDTVTQAWECLKDILFGEWTDGILCSFGMPVIKGSDCYNCQILCFNRKIIMTRPKMWLANDGNYRELQSFTAWKQKDLVDFQLPCEVSKALAVAAEVYEELFSPIPAHAELALNGVEVFMNASGSATHTRGGVYMCSNHQGCDGSCLYYDGCSCVTVNGDVGAQGSQFSLKDVEVVVAQIDLDVFASLRGSISSFQEQASCKSKVSAVEAPYKLCQSFNLQMSLSSPLELRYHSPEEEIAFGPACWLWDYLRSGASGFLFPLSGGADSSSVAAIAGCMCQLVVKEIANRDGQVKVDAIRIGHYAEGQFPTESKEFAKRIFYTVFMGSENSSELTRTRAKVLADEIGSWHLDVCVDGVISSFLSLFETLTGKRPHYKVDGGSNIENLGLQNIQARIRMVLALMLASLMPWVHSKPGFYLVPGSSNVDEGLRGYLTKEVLASRIFVNFYDGLPFILAMYLLEKLRLLLNWSLYNPTTRSDMGMTYEELSVYGRLWKIFRCGPVSMFKNLCYKWGATLTPLEVAEKVKHFFKYYSINRHKMTVLTPFYHAENYSPEDNRFDLRQFLYNTRWPYQFCKIDELVQKLDSEKVALSKSSNQENACFTEDAGMGIVAAGSGDPKAGL
ncbi:NAD(+) synthase (glutamine-hydrolyzing) [Bertholletia excelsa]